MGNRVYVTLKNKSQNKTYYLHWNGGLDTWCPLINSIFKNSITDIDLIEKLREVLEFKMEYSNNYGLQDIEENGHYIIDLNKKTFVHKFEVKNNLTELYDIHTRLLKNDLKEEFEDYLIKNIKIEYQSEKYYNEKRINYWDNITKATNDFFEKNSPLKNKSMNKEVEKFIKESKYSATLSEKVFIKKRIKGLETSDYTIKCRFVGNQYNITVQFKNKKYFSLNETNKLKDRYHYSSDTVPLQVDHDLFKLIKDQIETVLEPHQIVFQEGDMMTDIPSLKRLKYIQINYEFDSKILKELRRK